MKIIYSKLLATALLFISVVADAQNSALSVEKIMRDPTWMGVSPENVFWDQLDGQVYFDWNPEVEPLSALYTVSPKELTPRRVEETAVRQRVRSAYADRSGGKLVYIKEGDIYVFDRKSRQESRLTRTLLPESNPVFGHDGTKVIFRQGNNLFAVTLADGRLEQLTNITTGNPRSGQDRRSEQNTWL